ncbi:MAG TPA: tetratricopeptide repeat protein [Anaeromyxobacter sp.]
MSADRFHGFVFSVPDLSEDVDLDVERRKEILFAEAHLAEWSHWEVLGLPWNASAADAKASYLEKVKVFHPDRYPGKRLGSYRARLERVFRRLTEARDVLVDEGKRAVYARASAPADEFARMEVRKLENEKRSAERRARLMKQSPLFAKVARVQDLVARGKSAFARGDFATAANDLLLAQGMDPKNAEIAGLAAEAKRKAAAVRANGLYEKGLEAEAMGSWSSALALHREALEADPSHVRAASHATRATLALGDLAGARALAEGALRASPRSGAAHEALGLVLEAEGNKREARRELEKAVELDPRLESAKERLRKLRLFGGILG